MEPGGRLPVLSEGRLTASDSADGLRAASLRFNFVWGGIALLASLPAPRTWGEVLMTERAALERLVRGELGGPWGIFIKTYALGAPIAARFTVGLAEHATTAAVGDAVVLSLQTMTNPVTQAEVHPEIVLPEGLVVKRATLAASKEFRVGPPVGIDHSGQYAAFGRFEYS